MPMSYRIYPVHQLVIATGSGTVNDSHLLAYFDALRQHPAFHPSFRHLSIYRALAQSKVTKSGMQHIVANIPFLRGVRRAFVVGTPAAQELVTLFQNTVQYPEGQVAVFDDCLAACAWLGIREVLPDYILASRAV